MYKMLHDNYLFTFDHEFIEEYLSILSVRDFDEHFEKYLFLQTTHFRFSGNSVTKHNINHYSDMAFNAYGNFYKGFCKKLLGDRFNKRIHLQPLSITSLDVAGTRDHRQSPGFSLPHLHSLVLAHPKTIVNFNDLINCEHKGNDPLIEKVEFRPYVKTVDGIRAPVSYCNKFARNQLKSNLIDNAHTVYPNIYKLKEFHFKYIDIYKDLIGFYNNDDLSSIKMAA